MKTKLEQHFEEAFNRHMIKKNYKEFKSSHSRLFAAIMEALDKVNNLKDKATYNKSTSRLFCEINVKKVRLSSKNRKLFVYCGVFTKGEEKIIVLREKDGLQHYFSDDKNLISKLDYYQTGQLIGLKLDENKPHLYLPHDEIKGGLFE